MARRKWTKEEISEYRKKNGVFFYFNKEDSNFIVPKVYGFGLDIQLGESDFVVSCFGDYTYNCFIFINF